MLAEDTMQGKLRKAYVFNMKLGYSRYDYWEIVFDQKVETWINCHVKAFRYFCGVPKVIKLDNLKAGVTKVDIYEPLYQKDEVTPSRQTKIDLKRETIYT